jgi:hypothetical protein
MASPFSAGVFTVTAEPFEWPKDPLIVFRTGANAIILYPEQPITLSFLSGDRYLRSRLTSVLDGISDEVVNNR